MEAAVQKSNEELVELKKLQTEWQTKLNHIASKKAELEEYVEEFNDEAMKSSKVIFPSDSHGTWLSRMKFVCP